MGGIILVILPYFIFNIQVCDNATISKCGFNEENYTLTIDSSSPSGIILTPENNSYNGNYSQNFSINATDNIELKNLTLFLPT